MPERNPLQPEVELFLLWRNGQTSIDIRQEPDDIGTILMEMDQEYWAHWQPHD